MNKSSDPGSPELLAEGSLLGALGAPARLKALGSALLQPSLLSAWSSVLRGDLDSRSHSVLPRAHHLSHPPARGPGDSCSLPRVALALFTLTGSQAPLHATREETPGTRQCQATQPHTPECPSGHSNCGPSDEHSPAECPSLCFCTHVRWKTRLLARHWLGPMLTVNCCENQDLEPWSSGAWPSAISLEINSTGIY